MPVLIPAGNPGALTGPGTNTWLLDGPHPALIDAGTGTGTHLDAIAARLGGRPLSNVFVTHGHPDHASGIGALKERWPQLGAHKWLVDERVPGADEPWRSLEDGALIQAGTRTLKVIYTPGHAPDHVCFWDPASRELYGGDMLISGSTVMIPGGKGGNLRAYLRSLERVAALDPVRVLPGHGPTIEDPRRLINEYLEHRREREAQVRACLADGVDGLDAIVARIYPDIADTLRPAARLTVVAHLEKIKEEGEG